MNQSNNIKYIVRSAILGSIQYIIFYMFSDILYIELITFTTVLIADVFTRKEAVKGSFVFAISNILTKQGITFYSLMYLIIYPIYSLIISYMPKDKNGIKICCCFIFSILTGQLLQLPFMIFSSNITIYYIIIGLKTSIIQGVITLFISYMIYTKVKLILIKIVK